MTLTVGFHTHIMKSTLDFCDKEKREFREFISGRLSGDFLEGDAQEWVNTLDSFRGHRNRDERWGTEIRECLRFYYEQSQNTVCPRTAYAIGSADRMWTDESWNMAANEIYRYKFLGSEKKKKDLVFLFNSTAEVILRVREREKGREREREGEREREREPR